MRLDTVLTTLSSRSSGDRGEADQARPEIVSWDVHLAAIADSAGHPRDEITVPRWLAPIGALEEVMPEPLLQRVKHLVTLGRPPGHYDPAGRRAYLDRIGR